MDSSRTKLELYVDNYNWSITRHWEENLPTHFIRVDTSG